MIRRVERVGPGSRQAEELAAAVRQGRKKTVLGLDARGRAELFRDVNERLGLEALLLRVPSGLDQVEAVLLDAARLLGNDALRAVDATLRDRLDDVHPALETLQAHLCGRKLLVDNVDALRMRNADPELRVVVQDRRATLEAWLQERAAVCGYCSGEAGLPGEIERYLPRSLAPYKLADAGGQDLEPLWTAVGKDLSQFRNALTLAQVREQPPAPTDPLLGHRDDMFEAIWEALPEPHREILLALAVHERPLPDDILRTVMSTPGEPALEEVRSLAAIGNGLGGMWVDEPWQRFLRSRQSVDEIIRVHLSLATAFAGNLDGTEANAWAKAPWLMEAHRHYAAGGELGRALQFARYGVALLLSHAATQSRGGAYIPAVETFESVLKLDEKLLSQRGGTGVGARARAYAIHYLHYNRHKSKPSLESIAGTEQGYRQSVDLWPENALFWSRLALTIFLENEPVRALETLAEASAKVPDHSASFHSGKAWYLCARAVKHLLRYEPPRALEALHVWGEYRPSDLRERVVERTLWSTLSTGIRTAILEVPGIPAVHFHREVLVKIQPAGKAFACTISDLGMAVRAPDGLSALAAAVDKLRKETERYRATPTHTLDADQRAQKRRLLGCVDLVASRLLGEVPSTTWILGKVLVGERGKMQVREVGSGARVFDLDPSVEPPLLPDASARLVRVRTGPAGEPTGPVVDLEEPLGQDQSRVWAEWRRRLGDSEDASA